MDKKIPFERKAVMPPKDKYFGFLTGHALSLRENRLGYMYKSLLSYGDFLIMFLGKKRTLLVNDPIALKYVLFDNAKNYPKNTPGYQRVAEVIGMGVFTDVGEEWRRGRRVIQPIFNPSKFDRYFDLINQESERVVEKMIIECHTGELVDLSTWSTKYALQIIGRSLLDESLEGSFDEISGCLTKLIELTEKKMTSLLPFRNITARKEHKEFKAVLARLDKEIQKIIDNERNKPRKGQGNFIHTLMDAPERFSEEKILSQVKTMIFAGHETSANVIAWGFYFLVKYPEWQDKIYQEMKENNFQITSEDQVRRFVNVNLFLNEVLRMRPPVWSFGRVAVANDKIHGEQVHAGDLISVSPYLMHHHPGFWEKPEEFNPDRFLKTPTPLSFIPYGAGQRVCMGERLANLEIAVIFSKIAASFNIVSEEENFEIPMNAQISLRLERPLKVRLLKR
jgi:cytochrome P450